MSDSKASKPLWTPSSERIKSANLSAFSRHVNLQMGLSLDGYDNLHRWSVDNREEFWSAIWDWCAIKGEKGQRILDQGGKMPGASFFSDAKLNYAENLLKHEGDGDALVFRAEDKAERRWSWDKLRAEVSRLQQAMASAGVGEGDRVAAMMPNMPETIAIFLAASSIGAIFSSCSPDFGVEGVIDRFGQIEPKLFFACDGYWYAGKTLPLAEKLAAISARLPTVANTIIVRHIGSDETTAAALANGITLDDFVSGFPAKEPDFVRLPFNHPLYILYSSGTTGIPKCIVHGAGGSLIQHVKEHRLHADLNAGDRLFYFSTCGWMMWNWLVSGLASGATLLLFDGSPFHPDGNVLFDYADAERMTYFGTSAKYIDALRKSGLRPIETHDLSSLKTLSSTGSPLSPEGFSFVYDGIKKDIHLASISGGTDIVSCFVLGVPTLPVFAGEIQAAGLGMAVDVWDDDGKPVVGEKGELVCAKAFPSMPVKFWNDPEGAKYRAAYFERFDNVWCHGDFAEWTENGGLIIHGRSDATLNPGGVRIGTAEIYNQVEQLPEIIESICIGQNFDDDVRVVLFVRLREGVMLDDPLRDRIRKKIRAGASPRHVPAKIVAVTDIPRTKSGKITELAVRDMVHGRTVKNTEALANPEALDLYRDMPDLRS
jgi:acetoacetyl-CoA synthetase